MKKTFLLLSLLVVFAMLLAACGGGATEAPAAEEPAAEEPAAEEPAAEEPAADEMPYAGETVTVFSACGEEQCIVFQSTFEGFIAETGIDVVVEGSSDFETLATVRSEAGDPYDILNFPQPGLMADFTREGFLVDLNSFLSDDEVSAAFPDAYVDSGKVDGTLVGLWHGADVKSLVWYPKAAFEAAGYTVPETWDDLLALSDQIVADGSVPWCIGIESGGATGWAGTDWIEDIMLRTTSPENYDKWTTGELDFASPEVKAAFEKAGEIWFNEDYVLGGTTGILTTNFGDSPTPLFDDPPTCFMHRQASFIPNFFPEDAVLGEDVDYFYLPPIDETYGKPVLGSGNLVSMAKDTPAGQEVMKFMLTPASVESEVKAGNSLAVMKGVPDDWYPSTTAQGFAGILANAETFRFDGSDLMPGAVGTGSFWTGVVDYVSGEGLDTVLAAIDASWPE
ncbi:MAG: ABC transporter substrate-binding protein [Anaerolineales bacterium]